MLICDGAIVFPVKTLLKPVFELLDLAAYALIRVLVALIQYLPDRLSLVLCRACIWLLRLFMPRSSTVGRTNLRLVFPEKTEREREEILQRSYEVLARHLMAFAKAPMLTRERAMKMYDYSEIRPVWERARQSAPPGTGCIIVTAHFGSFELLHHAHALQDRKVAVLSRPFASPRVERFTKIRREMFGNIQFSRNGGQREIMRYLKEGIDVLLVVDQNVRKEHAVFVDFFGIPAATTKVVALASIRTGAPVFFATAVETSPWHFKMLFAPIGIPDDFPGSLAEKITGITGAMHGAMERAIREYPEQWMWIHRRYKTRPPGEEENVYTGAGHLPRGVGA